MDSGTASAALLEDELADGGFFTAWNGLRRRSSFRHLLSRRKEIFRRT